MVNGEGLLMLGAFWLELFYEMLTPGKRTALPLVFIGYAQSISVSSPEQCGLLEKLECGLI